MDTFKIYFLFEDGDIPAMLVQRVEVAISTRKPSLEPTAKRSENMPHRKRKPDKVSLCHRFFRGKRAVSFRVNFA